MFTGIIQAIGAVAHLEKKEDLFQYAISFPKSLLDNLKEGASISVNGVCQTIVTIQDELVWFDAISETLEKTTLHNLKVGQKVNLERSAKIGDEIGGHLLSGHVFGTPKIEEIDKNTYTFQCPLAWTKYLFPKGFVALDGISLTLGDIDRENGLFTVHLIPETLSRTTLGEKRLGDFVNLEVDALIQAAVETVERILLK